MAQMSPDLQEKLNELERELEVRPTYSPSLAPLGDASPNNTYANS
jgi:hypothetical protein